MTQREGSYPPPPYWPERLASGPIRYLGQVGWVMALLETSVIHHTYIADGYPGPCITEWLGDQFGSWHPALTVERALRIAAL